MPNPTTTAQRFIAGRDYPPIAVTSGEFIGTFSNTSNNVGFVGSGATGYGLSTSTLPVGAQTYTSYALGMDLQATVSGTTAQTITLPDCQGYSHERQVWNTNGSAATVAPGATGFGGSFTQTINGASTFSIPAGSTGFFSIVPSYPGLATCSWRAHL
jgi:hypothetical protein